MKTACSNCGYVQKLPEGVNCIPCSRCEEQKSMLGPKTVEWIEDMIRCAINTHIKESDEEFYR